MKREGKSGEKKFTEYMKGLSENIKKSKQYKTIEGYKKYLGAELMELGSLASTVSNGALYNPGGVLYNIGRPLHVAGEYMFAGGNVHDSFMPEVQGGLVALMGITAVAAGAKYAWAKRRVNISEKASEAEGIAGKEKNAGKNMEDILKGLTVDYKKPVLKKLAKITEDPELENGLKEYLSETKKIDFSKIEGYRSYPIRNRGRKNAEYILEQEGEEVDVKSGKGFFGRGLEYFSSKISDLNYHPIKSMKAKSRKKKELKEESDDRILWR